MKRFISFLLVFCVVLSVISIPVSAEDELGTWFSVYDISSMASNYYVDGEAHLYIPVSLAEWVAVSSFSIVFWDPAGLLVGEDLSWSCDFVSSDTTWENDTIISLGNNMYRWYGTYDGTDDWVQTSLIELNFWFSEEVVGSIQFLSFYLNSVPYTTYDIECYCDILSMSYGASIHYVPTDTINYREWEAGSNFEFPFLQLDLHSTDWTKYDFIDFIVSINCLSITSVCAFRDGVQIPLEYTMTNNSSIGTPSYTIMMRLDLRSLDRTNVSLPSIHIDGQESPNSFNSVNVVSCVGGLVYDVPSFENNFLNRISAYLAQVLSTVRSHTTFISGISQNVINIKNVLSNKDSEVNDMENAVETQGQELDSMLQEMNSVTRPPLDDVDGDFSEIVSTDDLVLASQGLGSLLNNDIILSIFTMSLLLCLASYVFFGKK